MKRILIGLYIVVSALTGGCAGTDKETTTAANASKPDPNLEKLKRQASFDLQCDAAQLKAVSLNEDNMMWAKMATYGVSGCGRQATYKMSCPGMGMPCTVFNEAQARSIVSGQ